MNALLPIAKDGLSIENNGCISLLDIIDEIKHATRGLLEVRSIYRSARLTNSQIASLIECRKRVRTRLAKRKVRTLMKKKRETEIANMCKERDRLLKIKHRLSQEILCIKASSDTIKSD